MKKCKRCNSCCTYKQVEGMLFLYCDFCDIYYHRQPGGELMKVDDLNDYIQKTRTLSWTIIRSTEGK